MSKQLYNIQLAILLASYIFFEGVIFAGNLERINDTVQFNKQFIDRWEVRRRVQAVMVDSVRG